eukprot:TRINITY_DN29365_c0_g1_i1.p1 TRINITY_DN29365_c0_g1~~TRINITY_DN29365_c0_g1_i1.p1  ORF type:complete len:200 (-),score=42.46 TRINITY_DN29365_c0_g1_i1:170-769(-)
MDSEGRLDTKALRDALREDIRKAKNFFTRSKRFAKWVRAAFDEVDEDKSGSLDMNEVYTAILFLYVQIASSCPGALPPPKEDMKTLFNRFDDDKSGDLNFDEFENFCAIVAAEISGRLIVQAVLTKVVAPWLGVAAFQWWASEMKRFLPEQYGYWSQRLPSGLSVTVLVSLAVSSLFAAPLMRLVDWAFAKETARFKKA